MFSVKLPIKNIAQSDPLADRNRCFPVLYLSSNILLTVFGLSIQFRLPLRECLNDKMFQVQVRPWRLADINYELRGDMILDVRRTVFIGGVPRPTRAGSLFIETNLTMKGQYNSNSLSSAQ